jgi:hypothetical protein
MDADILRHELAHGLANLFRGAPIVVIRWDDDFGATAEPKWPDTVTQDDVFIGLLAGRLHTDGVDTSHDEMILSQLPKQEITRLWAIVLDEVKPRYDQIPDEVITDMLACFASGGHICLSPEILH